MAIKEIVMNSTPTATCFSKINPVYKYKTGYTLPYVCSDAHGCSASPSLHVMDAITDVTMTVTCNNPVRFTDLPGLYTIGRDNIDINFLKITKFVRILGLIAVISYMIVILFVWIYANMEGYMYFSAGEPVVLIKYSEWALGAAGIAAAFDCLRNELKSLSQSITSSSESLWAVPLLSMPLSGRLRRF